MGVLKPVVTVLKTGRAVYTCGMTCAIGYEQLIGTDKVKMVIM